MTRTRLRAPAPVRVVFDGQSRITAASGNPPAYVMAGTGVPWVTVAVPGDGWYDLTATAATRLWPQARTTGTDVLVLAGGEGDIWNAAPSGQQTGAVAYARLVAYADAARTAGFDAVIACTAPPAGPDVLGTGRPTPSEVEALDGYNALIRGSDEFDAVADVAAALPDATDTDLFLIDRTHLTAAGAQVSASVIAPVLAPFLTP